jgi:small GTP-binding protein
MNLCKSQNLDTKVIIVGDASVGKTSILSQFNHQSFTPDTEATVGAMFLAKQVPTSHGPVSLLMWDTAGQERYRSLIPMYSRNASAAIIVVDVTNQSSFDSIEEWFRLLKENCPPTARFYVVANKMDLPIEIDLGKLERFAKKQNCPFFKVSAMRFESVEPIFVQIAEDFAPLSLPISQKAKVPVEKPSDVDDDGCC